MEQYVKSDRFVQLDGSHVTTDQAKLEGTAPGSCAGRMGYLRTDSTKFPIRARELTGEQRKALEHILASRDQVMDVSGIAGAGKSHLLGKLERAAVFLSKSVAVLSPTDASVLEQSGAVRYVELLQTQRQKVPALKPQSRI